MQTSTASERFHVKAGEGEARWWFGGAAQMKATAEQTEGRLTLMEILVPEGGGPLHVHHGEHEGFWIIEGRFRFEIGDERFDARPGDFVWGPRDIPHRFDCVDGPGRMLYVFAPGGFEAFVRETSDPADAFRLPDEGAGVPDMAAMPRALERANAEMLEA